MHLGCRPADRVGRRTSAWTSWSWCSPIPPRSWRGSWRATAWATRRRARAHREPDAGGREGEARRLRDRQLGRPRAETERQVREVYERSSTTCDGARRRAMSPRRNARAAEVRPARRRARARRARSASTSCATTRMADRIVELVAPTARDLVVGDRARAGRADRSPGLRGRAARGARGGRGAGRALCASASPTSPHVEIARRPTRASFDYALAAPRSSRIPPAASWSSGNLPYSVGKPILVALVEAGGAIDEMALMLQKEVAERVAAAPGRQGLRQHCRS